MVNETWASNKIFRTIWDGSFLSYRAVTWCRCTCRGFTWSFESGCVIQSGPNTLSLASTRFISAVLTSGGHLFFLYLSSSLPFSLSLTPSWNQLVPRAHTSYPAFLSYPLPPSLSLPRLSRLLLTALDRFLATKERTWDIAYRILRSDSFPALVLDTLNFFYTLISIKILFEIVGIESIEKRKRSKFNDSL